MSDAVVVGGEISVEVSNTVDGGETYILKGDADCSLDLFVDGELSLTEKIDGSGGTVFQHGEYDEYTDEIEFTPSLETQTIHIANKITNNNITIKPIPSNYGLITWNGSTLTVS